MLDQGYSHVEACRSLGVVESSSCRVRIAPLGHQETGLKMGSSYQVDSYQPSQEFTCLAIGGREKISATIFTFGWDAP